MALALQLLFKFVLYYFLGLSLVVGVQPGVCELGFITITLLNKFTLENVLLIRHDSSCAKLHWCQTPGYCQYKDQHIICVCLGCHKHNIFPGICYVLPRATNNTADIINILILSGSFIADEWPILQHVFAGWSPALSLGI